MMKEKGVTQNQSAGIKMESIPIMLLHPFQNHPFKVLLDESMYELVESVKSRGVLTPVAVRPYVEKGYEILSGHRRVQACKIAGISKVPAKIMNLNDDMAIIFVVDSNIQREQLLPSEKAYAYKMKMDAMKRQGLRSDLTSSQFGTKFRTDETVAKEVKESRNQIHRYIRLTNLVYPLLDMVDEKKVPINSAVELSYLGTKAQTDIVYMMKRDEISVSMKQAMEIRRRSEEGKIQTATIESILREQTAKDFSITLKEKRIRKYFPKDYTKKQIENIVFTLLDQWFKEQSKKKSIEEVSV